MMIEYLNDLINFKEMKNWGKGLRKLYIIDMIRNLIYMLIGVGLYLWLDNTGLLIYLILINKIHWSRKEES